MKPKAMAAAAILLLETLTGTAQAQFIDLNLEMPSPLLYPTHPFWLRLAVENSGPAVGTTQLFVALDIGLGDFWFYPSWCHYPPDLDWVNPAVPEGSSEWEIIPVFNWPAGAGSGSARFLAAIMKDGGLMSNVAVAAFGWSETQASEFVSVPADAFLMGSPPDEMCRSTDETRHSVTLTHGFHIERTEVTQAEWVAIFGVNPSDHTGCDQCPVETITWFDCAIYCNRLSAAAGLRRAYYSDGSYTTPFDGTPPLTSGTVYWDQTAPGYRLPTEAEWEYACRAGVATAYNSGQDNLSCYGEDANLNPLAWYWSWALPSKRLAKTHPVGGKQPNAWNLCDMHGNALEWCWDWEGAYPGTVTDPTGPGTGSGRVLRGGSSGIPPGGCRSAVRHGRDPGFASESIGFRPARVGP